MVFNFFKHWHKDNMVDTTNPPGPVRYYRCSNNKCSSRHKLSLFFNFTKFYYIVKTCKRDCKCHLQNNNNMYTDF